MDRVSRGLQPSRARRTFALCLALLSLGVAVGCGKKPGDQAAPAGSTEVMPAPKGARGARSAATAGEARGVLSPFGDEEDPLSGDGSGLGSPTPAPTSSSTEL